MRWSPLASSAFKALTAYASSIVDIASRVSVLGLLADCYREHDATWIRGISRPPNGKLPRPRHAEIGTQ